MKQKIGLLLGLVAMMVCMPTLADVVKGQSYELMANLHTDGQRNRLYAVNYQLNGKMIPVCSKVTIKKVSKKRISFVWNGADYTFEWDRNLKKAGVSLQQVANGFFGAKCPKAKIAKMSKLDKAGIESGLPSVGMTKEGILIAMGHPPQHANPSLDATEWMYWLNRFKRKAVVFDAKGKVKQVRL